MRHRVSHAGAGGTPERSAPLAIVTAAAALLLASGPAAALELSKSRIAGGGTSYVTVGDWSLAGTVGQHEAGEVSGRVWTLRGGFWTGGGVVTGVDDGPGPVDGPPLAFRVHAIEPNPIRDEGLLRFELPHEGRVTAEVFDIHGRRVRLLLDSPLPRGHHTVAFGARASGGDPLPAGVYLIRLTAAGQTARQRVVVLR